MTDSYDGQLVDCLYTNVKRGASAAESAYTERAKTYFCGGICSKFYVMTTLTLTLTDRHDA